MKLNELIGKHILQGIELGTEDRKICGFMETCNYVIFKIDDISYIAYEDPNDGYRSYCEELKTIDKQPQVILPDIEVMCIMAENTVYETNNVLRFIDVVTGKDILRVGTANTDDYYPYCVFEYHPENMCCNANKGE